MAKLSGSATSSLRAGILGTLCSSWRLSATSTTEPCHEGKICSLYKLRSITPQHRVFAGRALQHALQTKMRDRARRLGPRLSRLLALQAPTPAVGNIHRPPQWTRLPATPQRHRRMRSARCEAGRRLRRKPRERRRSPETIAEDLAEVERTLRSFEWYEATVTRATSMLSSFMTAT